MDPLTLASAFATVVGLLINFKSERESSKIDYSNFIVWLNEKKFDQLVKSIEKNNSLSESIEALFEQNNDFINQQFEGFNEVMLNMASKIDGLSDIALSYKPNLTLSDQCISILKQLDDSGASRFIEQSSLGKSVSYHTMDGKRCKITYDEPRFIEDDLNTLVEFGFLRPDLGGRGSRFFHITRSAIAFLKTV